MAIDGMSNRMKLAATSTGHEKEELLARSNACHQCMLAVLEPAALAEERDIHQAWLSRMAVPPAQAGSFRKYDDEAPSYYPPAQPFMSFPGELQQGPPQQLSWAQDRRDWLNTAPPGFGPA